MAWYDWFAHIYDSSLQRYYAVHRQLASEALQLQPGLHVLDLPCGTGASLPAIAAGVGDEGAVLGVDLSAGMLRQASRRVLEDNLVRARLARAAAGDVDSALVRAELGTDQVDRLHVFLGMSVFDDMQGAFESLWAALSPGGLCVLVDVHSAELSLQGRMVNWLAQADIRRRFWEPLQACCEDFELRDLPYEPKHGGQIMLASGRKPLPTLG